MARGKNTNVHLSCSKCKMQNYTTRINKKTTTKLEQKKHCHRCNAHTSHASGSEIKHSS
ncbi:50S ribosomal protein L33 [Candidatus Peregrinibacteria bacterium CG_4_10_14_0_2_um_filter_43_11]|nr:MAG: 50S ribosomal protein L33 [Candidatus Peregrinibacteria bacterium CG_4_10_14_0_2_um_filter_43_11]